MAVTAKQFTNAAKHLVTDTLWLTDTIKVALVASTYTPDQDAHEFFSSVTGELATAAGYTAGGATLASKTVTSDATTNETRLDAADTSFTVPDGSTLTARYAVVYKSTGAAATSPLLGWIDFGANVTASAAGTTAPFTITWDATGILKFTAA